MRGRWRNFDDRIQIEEVSRIPQPDRGALFFAMSRYARGDDAGFEVKDYGDELLMLKKKGLSGRSLFFFYPAENGTLLILPLAYKKESNEAPASLLATARERKGRYIESQRNR